MWGMSDSDHVVWLERHGQVRLLRLNLLYAAILT